MGLAAIPKGYFTLARLGGSLLQQQYVWQQPLFLRAGFCLFLIVLFFRCLPDDLLGQNDHHPKLWSLLWLHLGVGGVPWLPVYHPVVMSVNQPLSQQLSFLGHLCITPSLLFQQPDPPFLLLCLTSWFSR